MCVYFFFFFNIYLRYLVFKSWQFIDWETNILILFLKENYIFKIYGSNLFII